MQSKTYLLSIHGTGDVQGTVPQVDARASRVTRMGWVSGADRSRQAAVSIIPLGKLYNIKQITRCKPIQRQRWGNSRPEVGLATRMRISMRMRMIRRDGTVNA